MTEHEKLVEQVALNFFNRMRVRRGMKPVDYIGANNTPECNECREDARAALSVIREALSEPTLEMLLAMKTWPNTNDVHDIGDIRDAYRAMIAASPLGEG